MKRFIFILMVALFACTVTYAQTPRAVSGEIIDSAKMPVAGVSIKLVSEKGDSATTSTNSKGYFSFQQVKGNRLMLTFSSVGYQVLIKHYTLDNDNKPANLGMLVLNAQANMLNQVNIIGVNPVTVKEDTVEYKISAYKVRDNAPLEDALRKMPGVDVDMNGNVTAQGKKVSKVRVNGKDFFGGDVRTATQNLPADVVQSVQMIDDYGDQANLTGIKTGEPDKIMNIMIKQDKNHGYTIQATVGDGADVLPKQPGVSNDNRYIGLINAFRFNGDQQIALLGNINNTNVNTFSFGDPATGPAGGSLIERKKLAADAFESGGGKGGGTGNRGNFSNQTSQQNGITTGHSAGANFRDQWGKNLAVYGSYSFSDNTVFTKNLTSTKNITAADPVTNTNSSEQTDHNINHRLTWNMEYKPDPVNYVKVSPSFSYSSTVTNYNSVFSSPAVGYSSFAPANGNTQGYGLTALYNHRFSKGGRNFSVNINLNSNPAYQYQNPQFTFTTAIPGAITNQVITTHSHTDNISTTLSYIEPLSEMSWLEATYAYNRSTTNDKETTLLDSAIGRFIKDDALSVPYAYTFTTNNFGLNYRYVQKGKYNFTLGIGAQPSVLDGRTPGLETHKTDWNIVPTAHMIYNFSRNSSLSFNYDGISSQPGFNQLQPVTDFSNAFYPVQGNPDLKPQFTNNLSLRYNQINFDSGELLFTNLSYNQTHNEVVTNTIIYPRVYTPDARFNNAYLTQYLNADSFYTASGYISYNKPWDKRKFSLMFSGNVAYTHTLGYITEVDSVTYKQTRLKNIAGNLQFTPGLRFRLDIPDKIDAQFFTNYSINKTSNSIDNAFTAAAVNLKTWNIGISGKNYILKDWTLSYDYSKALHYGYSSLVHITAPNLLNMYVERRFMKGNRATIRLAAFDLFNQNTGFSSVTTASTITQTNSNRLGRYYLATFTMRLQKFAGK